MTTDLWMLVYTTLLCLAAPVIYVGGEFAVPGGVAWGLGNRDSALDMPAWAARAKRAHYNLVENLAPFAAIVLTVHVAGMHNAMTALGATIFFWGRVAHLLVYAAGVIYLRTVVFFVAEGGLLLIVWQLF